MTNLPATTSDSGITRRRLFTLAGLGGAALAIPALLPAHAGAATETTTASCSSDTDEQEVGPFYVADGLVRSNVTEGQSGIAHTFTITLANSSTCSPLVGAAVDIWHANAAGVYSDEASENTTGQTYLRGVQISDSNGQVTFTSIMPGWYSGRTMHIHLRVYTGGTVSGSTYDYTGATLVHTGQMFFTEAVDAAVAAVAPYSANTTARTTNSTDRVYTEQNGVEGLCTTTGSTSTGYVSSASVTVTGGSTSTSAADTTTLSIASSATSVTAGGKVTLSGRLLDTTTSKGIADQDVTLKATLASGTAYTAVVETDDNGYWSLTCMPSTSAAYSVSYPGTSSHAAASSSSVTVAVAYRVAVSHVSSTAAAKYPVAVSGTVTPARKGVTVSLRSVATDGTLRTITTATTDAKGAWSAKWRASKGRHRFVAAVPSDGSNAAGATRTVVYYRT